MKKYEIWCVKHPRQFQHIMVAIVQRSETIYPGSVFEIKIKDIIYQEGYDDWKPGNVTVLVESDLKQPKEVVRFIFEETQ